MMLVVCNGINEELVNGSKLPIKIQAVLALWIYVFTCSSSLKVTKFSKIPEFDSIPQLESR